MNEFSTIASSVGTGASFGSIAGPKGAAIGAGVGALAGLGQSLWNNSQERRNARAANKEWRKRQDYLFQLANEQQEQSARRNVSGLVQAGISPAFYGGQSFSASVPAASNPEKAETMPLKLDSALQLGAQIAKIATDMRNSSVATDKQAEKIDAEIPNLQKQNEQIDKSIGKMASEILNLDVQSQLLTRESLGKNSADEFANKTVRGLLEEWKNGKVAWKKQAAESILSSATGKNGVFRVEALIALQQLLQVESQLNLQASQAGLNAESEKNLRDNNMAGWLNSAEVKNALSAGGSKAFGVIVQGLLKGVFGLISAKK